MKDVKFIGFSTYIVEHVKNKQSQRYEWVEVDID